MQRCRHGVRFRQDRHLSHSTSALLIAHGISGFAQRVRPVHDGSDLASLDEVSQDLKICCVGPRDIERSFWLTNGERTAARRLWRSPAPIQRSPPSDPTSTSVPSFARAVLRSDRERFPPVSTIR